MHKLKIITLLGTRPEIIKLSRTIFKLDKYCENIIVHTGQNYDYELNKVFFDDLKIRKPDFFLDCAKSEYSSANCIGNIINYFDKLLLRIKPEAILVLGDTNSGLGIIAAKKRKIPIFHMEAGNRCFDQRVPEEVNRKIIDHMSDINLTYSSTASSHLIKEGFPVNQIIKIGSPMKEVINHYKSGFEKSDILNKFKLTKGEFFLMSSHREENIEDKNMFAKLIETINFITGKYQLPLIISLHPRTKNKIIENKIKFNQHVRLSKPLGYFDYMSLQLNAKVVLSDSGTITEESSIMNFPALNIRQTHERHEGMEEATVIMSGLNYERIEQGLEILDKKVKLQKDEKIKIVKEYDVDNVSEKVSRIIVSYVDYINYYVWHKKKIKLYE